MNREGKITICILALIFMGIIIYQIDNQRRMLENVIHKHEQKLDIILQDYKDLNTYYDSLLHIVDSLPLGSPLDTLQVSSDYGWRRSPIKPQQPDTNTVFTVYIFYYY